LLEGGLECPVRAIYYSEERCPDVTLKYDDGMHTDKVVNSQNTLAFSSRTTYCINEDQFLLNILRVKGSQFGKLFKLSWIIYSLMENMQLEKLKKDIVHNVHILGCMTICEFERDQFQ